jgi:cytochrome P450
MGGHFGAPHLVNHRPGPRGWPIVGNLPAFRRDQLGFYAACARDYGDVVPVRFGPRAGLIVSHPDAIEDVLVTRARDFVKSPALRLMRPLLGAGLLLSEGDFWLRQRRQLQPAFHRQRIAGYGEAMTTLTGRHLAGWKDGATVEVHAEMMTLTQAIVTKTLFDADVSGDARVVGDALNVLNSDFSDRLGSVWQPPPWLPTPGVLRARRAIRNLDAIVYRIIADRRARGEDRGDLLSMVLAAQDADDGTRMTDRQVRDEIMTLFLAGHETTAVALSWTFYLLAQHPEAETWLIDELRDVLGGRAPTVADLPKLRRTDMVVTEAMRLYPPAYALGRFSIRPTEIAGERIQPRTIVVLATSTVQRDPRWFVEPDAFRPERWADDLARRLPRFAYFPFGGGPRQCIGNTFAQMEAVLVLATIAQRFRLALVPGQRVTATPYVTLRPEPGIRMLLTRR